MAGFGAVSAVGKSIERLLNAAFLAEQPISDALPTTAVLVRTEDFDPTNAAVSIPQQGLTIFLYRVDFNKTMRAAWSAVGSVDGKAHLPLDLHYLLTAWAPNAEHEHLIVGRTMQVLETTPIFSGPLLYPADPTVQTAEWKPNEAIQLLLEEIPTEALMRIFDSLPGDYKLSVPYIARVVRVESRVAEPAPPVTTSAIGVKPEAMP